MKYIILFFTILALISGIFYIVFKYFESSEKEFTIKKKIFYILTITLFVVLNLTNLMSMYSIYTTKIVVYNGNSRTPIEVKVNSKKLNLKPGMMGEIQTSSLWNRLKYTMHDDNKSESVGPGTYILSIGDTRDIRIREKRYKSLSGDYSNLHSDRFERTIKNELVKVDKSGTKCVFLPPGRRMPKYVKPKYKGKRMFITKSVRQ